MANATAGSVSRTWYATSDWEPIGLAGETTTPKAKREKYSTGTWSEGGERMKATWPLHIKERRERVREWN